MRSVFYRSRRLQSGKVVVNLGVAVAHEACGLTRTQGQDSLEPGSPPRVRDIYYCVYVLTKA